MRRERQSERDKRFNNCLEMRGDDANEERLVQKAANLQTITHASREEQRKASASEERSERRGGVKRRRRKACFCVRGRESPLDSWAKAVLETPVIPASSGSDLREQDRDRRANGDESSRGTCKRGA